MALAPYRASLYDNRDSTARMSDLIRRRGANRAALVIEEGDNAARTAALIAHGVGQSMSALANYAMDKPRREAAKFQLEEAKVAQTKRQREDAFTDTSRLLMNDPTVMQKGEDGLTRYDRAKLQASVQAAGYADRWPEIESSLNKSEAATLQFRALKQQAAVLQQTALGSMAYGVRALGNDPVAFVSAAKNLVENGVVDEKDVQPFLEAITEAQKEDGGTIQGRGVGVEQTKARQLVDRVTKALMAQSPEFRKGSENTVELSPGEQAWRGGQMIAENTNPPNRAPSRLSTEQDYIARLEAEKGGPLTAAEYQSALAQLSASTRAPREDGGDKPLSPTAKAGIAGRKERELREAEANLTKALTPRPVKIGEPPPYGFEKRPGGGDRLAYPTHAYKEELYAAHAKTKQAIMDGYHEQMGSVPAPEAPAPVAPPAAATPKTGQVTLTRAQVEAMAVAANKTVPEVEAEARRRGITIR